MDGQEKRCFVSWLLILHSGHRGEGCSVGLILCEYVRSIGDFPVRSCDRILLLFSINVDQWNKLCNSLRWEFEKDIVQR